MTAVIGVFLLEAVCPPLAPPPFAAALASDVMIMTLPELSVNLPKIEVQSTPVPA